MFSARMAAWTRRRAAAAWMAAIWFAVFPAADWAFHLLAMVNAAVALFAGLTGWLSAPARYRCLLMFLLMAHATVTELIQLNVEGRTGTLQDVAFDQVGIALGTILTWKWWRA